MRTKASSIAFGTLSASGLLLAHALAPGLNGLQQTQPAPGLLLNLSAQAQFALSGIFAAPLEAKPAIRPFVSGVPGADMPPAARGPAVNLRGADGPNGSESSRALNSNRTDLDSGPLPGGGMPVPPGQLGLELNRVERGEMFVRLASRYLGLAYLYGGSRPQTGFDCSGFTGYVYSKFGIQLPRSAHAQSVSRALKSTQKPIPGDLIFFKINKKRVSHVGLYVGDDLFIHSPRTGKSIEYGNLKHSYWRARFAGARTPK